MEVSPECFLSTSVRTTGVMLTDDFKAAFSEFFSSATLESPAAHLEELMKVMMFE